jgi:hypothetical protein
MTKVAISFDENRSNKIKNNVIIQLTKSILWWSINVSSALHYLSEMKYALFKAMSNLTTL